MKSRHYTYLIIICWALFGPSAVAQISVKRLEKQAYYHLNSKEWYLASPLLAQLTALEPNNAEYAFTAGICYFNTDNKGEGLGYFQKAAKLGYEPGLINFYLGRGYHFKLNFDSAIHYYENYQKYAATNSHNSGAFIPSSQEVEKYIKNCRFGKLLQGYPVELKIENLGSVINSPFPEYAPVISADEKVLMFTTRRSNTTGGGMDKTGRYYEDIFYSFKNNQGEWEAPQSIGNVINTNHDDACIGLSPDGKKLFVFNGLNGGDIFLSELKGNIWSKPQRIQGDINSPHWEGSASFTSNEEILYFSSDRPGGFGGSDIYYSKKLPDGTWGKAINLGPTINTPEDEDAPQIHVNGKTLFFSSKGHDGIGGYDIFSSTLNLRDSTWSKPKNMGFPINTADDDIYFSMNADGSKGYFTSYRKDGLGEQDIYVVHRPLSSPTHVILKGKVQDQHKNPLEALITLSRQKGQLIEKVIKSDAKTGTYSFELKFDENYNLTVEVDGYFYLTEDIIIESQPDIFEFVINFTAENDNFLVEVYDGSESAALNKPTDLNSIKSGERMLAYQKPAGDSNKTSNITYKEKVSPEKLNKNLPNASGDETEPDNIGKAIVKNRALVPLTVGKKIVLNNIYFDFNTAYLKKESVLELNNLYKLLDKNSSLYVEIAGHTDNTGDPKYNQKLSELRAKAVKDYLVSRGIDSKRLKTSGYGPDRPLVSNLTQEGRKMNRRTELEIIDPNNTDKESGANRVADKAVAHVNPGKRQDEGSAVILLPLQAHFLHNDGTYITDFTKEKLNSIIDIIKESENVLLQIVGFEDAENEDPAKELSMARAHTVYDYFIEYGIPPNHLAITSGDHKLNNLAEKGIKRRKVEFYLVRQ